MKWMCRRYKPHLKRMAAYLAIFALLVGFLEVVNPGTAVAKTEESDPADHFEVWLADPAGKNNAIELVNYTIAELEQMPQVERAYSSIDSLPAPVFTAARGIDLIEFLENHKIDTDNITCFKFRATDFDADNFPPDFGKVLQASNLLDSDRYYFPKIQEYWDECWDENIGNFSVGSEVYTREEETPIRPMLGIVSFLARAIASDPGKPVYLGPQFDQMDGTTRKVVLRAKISR